MSASFSRPKQIVAVGKNHLDHVRELDGDSAPELEEQVLCLPRRLLFADGAWYGVRTGGVERFLTLLDTRARFHPRGAAEENAAEQQIIPYCVVRFRDGRFFLTRRLTGSTEHRLHHRDSLGIGGHINPVDGAGVAALRCGLQREWHEEVICPSPASARLIGFLNDDTTPVSRVHFGAVFLVEPQGEEVAVRETGKLEGLIRDRSQLRAQYDNMESWSQLVFDHVTGSTFSAAAGSVALHHPVPLVVDLAPSVRAPGATAAEFG